MFDHFIKLEIAEPFEQRRRRELLAEIPQLDTEMAALVEERRIRHTSSGYVLHDALPTALRGPESLELENRMSMLVAKRDRVLAEYATL